MHSWTLAARPHYAHTNISIVEVVPPAVRSNLGGSHDYGHPCDEFCRAVFARIAQGESEIGYKESDEWRLAPRDKMLSILEQNTKNTFEGKYKTYGS